MSRKMNKLALATIVTALAILMVSESIAPAFATTGKALFISANRKYLTVEVYGTTIQIWLRRLPNICSFGDICEFNGLVRDINAAKSAYDAAQTGANCGMCVVWFSSTGTCAYVTLPTVYGEVFCGYTLYNALESCSSCAASLTVKIVFPKS